MNYSKQREKILDILTKNAVHPTAETLLGLLKADNSNIGFTTLYRNLNQLAQAGIIKTIDGLEASAHFDHNTFEHYHFSYEKNGASQNQNGGIYPARRHHRLCRHRTAC